MHLLEKIPNEAPVMTKELLNPIMKRSRYRLSFLKIIVKETGNYKI